MSKDGAKQIVQQNDLVLVSVSGIGEQCYFIGVCHTVKEQLLIVKTVISPELASGNPVETTRINNLIGNA